MVKEEYPWSVEESARRLSAIMETAISPQVLEDFRNSQGTCDRPVEIAPGLTGWAYFFDSGNFGVTFELKRGHGTDYSVEVQRIYNPQKVSREETIRRAANRLVAIAENSSKATMAGENCLCDYNVT